MTPLIKRGDVLMYKIGKSPKEHDDIVNKSYVDERIDKIWRGTQVEFETAKSNGEIEPDMIVMITNDVAEFDAQEMYETNEVETDKCFNGKTVYRRLYDATNDGSRSILNLDKVVSISGSFSSGNYSYPIPYVNPSDSNDYVGVYVLKNTGSDGYGILRVERGSSTTVSEGYIILEYTKI